MRNSLLLRFSARFFGDFVKTVTDDKLSYAALPAMALWFVVNAKHIRFDFWTVFGPLVFGASIVVVRHAWVAARAVISDIENERVTEVRSGILDGSGNATISTTVQELPTWYRARLYGTFAIMVFVCGTASFLSVKMYRVALAAESESHAPTPTPVELPTVEIKYEPGALPLKVVPKMRVYVLQINSQMDQLISEQVIDNTNGTKNLTFPSLKLPQGFNDLYSCTVQNHGGKDLVDVRIKFHFSGRKLIKVRDTWSKKKKTNAVTITTSGTDAMHWTEFEHGHTREYSDGDEEVAFDRTVVISSINAHDTAFVYLVNTCSRPIRFDLPNEGTAVVSGQSDRQNIKFIRPMINVLDALPKWGLYPTRIAWGLPTCG